MFFEVLSHVLNFDLAWLIPFVMDNLFWVFLLACIGHFIYGKGLIAGTLFAAFYLYATFDFATAMGWVFMKGFFWAPMLVFLSLMVYDSFFARAEWHSAKRPWFASSVFYLGLFFINVFLV